MKQYIILSREMETRDHRLPSVTKEKNGASPKSLTSRVIFFRKVFLALLAVCIYAIGYSQETDLETSEFDGTITAVVENGNDYNAKISKVVVVAGLEDLETIAEGDYKDGGFTLTLPPSFDEEDLFDIMDIFDDDGAGTMIISDEDAKILPLFDDNFQAFNSDGKFVGNFYYLNEDDDDVLYSSVFIYVDRDVTVTGSFGEITLSMSLIEGWNIIYTSQFDEYSGEYSTKAISGLKWVFYEYESSGEYEEDFSYSEEYDGAYSGELTVEPNVFTLATVDLLNLEMSDVTLEISEGTLLFPEIPILKIGDPFAVGFEDVLFNENGFIKAPDLISSDFGVPIPLKFSIIASESYFSGDDNEVINLTMRMTDNITGELADLEITYVGTKQASSNNFTILEAAKKVIGYYNFSGQMLDREPESGLYIIRYDDGTSKKVMRMRK